MSLTTDSQDIPVRIVGSSVFGIYPTISVERTYNMYITYSGDGQEEWLVNFPGFKHIQALILEGAEGRGIYRSVRGGFLLAVVAGEVFRIDQVEEIPTQLGTLSSSTGEVFFDENLSSQISIISEGQNKIYNYALAPGAISDAVYVGVPGDTQFVPNYVTYQNTYLIYGNALETAFGSQWVIFESGSDNTLPNAYKLNWVQTLAIQTKPDFAKAVLRIPGAGNNVIVFGSTVAEIWSNVGGQSIYQRNSSLNIDYGAASVATIASSEEIVAWLGINENSSPAIMSMQGGGAQRISTDGIDNLLSTVDFPKFSTGFLYRQGGHIFYILSFFHPDDNFTIVYDFTTKRFIDITDWDFSVFPARQIVYFNNHTYFMNFKNGGICELSNTITQYEVFSSDGINAIYDIPRVRLTNTFRFPTRPQKYKVKMFTFTIETGTTPNILDDSNLPRVDLTISKNGGNTFSNVVSYMLKKTGDYKSQPRFNNLGYANQIGYQMRFWCPGRIVVKNGTMEIGN